MDSKTRNTTILLVISLFALAIGLVLYANRESGTVNNQSVTSDNVAPSFVNGNELSEDELHAFLKDETFFDYDKNYITSGKDDIDTSTLYVIANSVDHDIRIGITDVFGHPVSGVTFIAKVDGLGEYSDINQDGIIKIPDLAAGDYYVSINPVDDYTVPTVPVRVSVKEQLEFKAIEDISLYIYSEDMIDVLAEDTEDGITTDDYDDTAHISNNIDSEGVFGIDVSKYQKDIDWERVARAGVKFAIIRCGYRGSKSGVLVEDPYFKRNIHEAKAAGIDVGVYFFTQAVNETEAVEEASMVAALCQEYDLDYPVFIDTEGAGGGRADGLSKEERTNVVVAFCKTVESSGYIPGVYSSRCWFYDKLDDSKLSEFVLWDAEYRDRPLYKGDYKLWQYSSKGSIDGIETNVDLDMCYTTFN